MSSIPPPGWRQPAAETTTGCRRRQQQGICTPMSLGGLPSACCDARTEGATATGKPRTVTQTVDQQHSQGREVGSGRRRWHVYWSWIHGFPKMERKRGREEGTSGGICAGTEKCGRKTGHRVSLNECSRFSELPRLPTTQLTAVPITTIDYRLTRPISRASKTVSHELVDSDQCQRGRGSPRQAARTSWKNASSLGGRVRVHKPGGHRKVSTHTQNTHTPGTDDERHRPSLAYLVVGNEVCMLGGLLV